MLVKCPKCGFEQPRDRFCANCGIDTEAYKPKISLSSKITSSALFYVFLIGLVVTATGLLLKRQLQPAFSGGDRTEVLVSARPAEGTAETAPPNGLPEPPIPVIAAAEPPTEPPEATPPSASLRAASTSESLAAFKGVEEQRAAAKQPTKTTLRMHLLEVADEVAREMVEERLSGDGDSGVLPSLSSFLEERSRGEQVTALVATQDFQFAGPDKPLLISQTDRDPRLREAIGLFIQVLPLSLDERGLHARIEIKRVLPAPGTSDPVTADTQSVVKELMLPVRSAGFFLGLLPHAKREADETVYKDFLKVLSSPRFQGAETEFILVLELTNLTVPKEAIEAAP